MSCSGDSSITRSLVEVMGVEPTTSSMRPKRSSQLSYTPKGSDECNRGPFHSAPHYYSHSL